MKKITMALGILLSTALSIQAQEKSILLYGGLDGGGGEYSLDLGVGYQFSENLTAGINLMNKSDGYTSGGVPVSFMVGPFLRYTKPMTQLISVYGQANFGFGSGTSVSQINLGVTPGVQINIKNGLALYMEVGNVGWNRTTVASVATSSTKFNLGRGLSFGIQKNFGGVSRKK